MRGSVLALWCATGCCLAGAAAATTDPLAAAHAVVERYVAVTGGRVALAADTLLHARGRIADAGMNGTFEEWRRGADHVLRNEHLGLLRTRMGYDGAHGWTTDFTSRKVGPLEGKDLEALRAEAWFASEQWARDRTLRLTLGPSSFLSGRTLQAIEVTPPVGPRKTLWFDQQTCLLVRITQRRALRADPGVQGRRRTHRRGRRRLRHVRLHAAQVVALGGCEGQGGRAA